MEINNSEAIFSIGQAAQKVGISVSTLRLYERERFLCPIRTDTARRLYSLNDLRVVETVHRLVQEEGLNFAGIRRLFSFLPCWKINNCDPDSYQKCRVPRLTDRPCWGSDESIRKECRNDCQECPVYSLAYKIDQLNVYDLIEGKNPNCQS